MRTAVDTRNVTPTAQMTAGFLLEMLIVLGMWVIHTSAACHTKGYEPDTHDDL